MKFLQVSEESLNEGAEIIKNGGLVAFPTETVYGLGADAFNPLAIAKVFEAKNRPHFDPLIIHIAKIETLDEAADLSLLNKETRKKLFLLAEKFWPGPLSIILPKNKKIPDIATAGLQTAAIRMPDNETALKLISLSTGAIAAPSANPFGSLSPTRAEHVREGLGEKIDLILDGGQSRIGVESTVLDISGGSIKILRPGGTPREAIFQITGIRGQETEIRITNVECKMTNIECGIRNEGLGIESREPGVMYNSPGMLKSHYAPKARLFVMNKDEIIKQDCKIEDSTDQKTAFLFFDAETREAWRYAQMPRDNVIIKTLSESGSIVEAASQLFELLHELDSCGVCRIYAQKAPAQGLGEAINDRLRRGAGV